MFDKVLIANRGEIAVRVIHACRELGISTVAVYSEADRESLHAQIADEAVCIGPAKPKDSYLNVKSIISACEITGADAIHPGFGFLSENSGFAKMCDMCGIEFIGPCAEAMENLGNKANARRVMKNAGVPVIPGSDGLILDINQALKVADEIGYPVMVKATAGGGGRGIRRVDSKQDLEASIVAAQTEAQSFFGNSGIYIEKFIENPRHVEIQIIADKYGNIVHLGERDCSVQRRNQKLIEETPSPAVSAAVREKMGEAAILAARASGYYNAGTVEFLLDKDENFYFMEMNTRIQVEHGITELVTGVDIVKNQIKIADSQKLNISQSDISINGHAIECRINAEIPEKNFMPVPGQIKGLYIPCGNGIRVDSSVYSGYTITPHYDSMIAKVMAHAPTRNEAIAKMRWALAEFIVEGISTNIDFQLALLRNEEFRRGDVDVGFLGRLGY